MTYFMKLAVFLAVFTTFIYTDMQRDVRAETFPNAAETVKIDALGLVCDFCAQALEKVFNKQDHVTDIKVDLGEKIVMIGFDKVAVLSDEQITKLVTDAGYNVQAIRREQAAQDDDTVTTDE